MRIAGRANWRQGSAPFRAITAGARIDDPGHRPFPTHRLADRGHSNSDRAAIMNYIVAIFLIVSGVIGLGLVR